MHRPGWGYGVPWPLKAGITRQVPWKIRWWSSDSTIARRIGSWRSGAGLGEPAFQCRAQDRAPQPHVGELEIGDPAHGEVDPRGGLIRRVGENLLRRSDAGTEGRRLDPQRLRVGEVAV